MRGPDRGWWDRDFTFLIAPKSFAHELDQHKKDLVYR